MSKKKVTKKVSKKKSAHVKNGIEKSLSRKTRVKIRKMEGEFVIDENIGTEVELETSVIVAVASANANWEVSQKLLADAVKLANH